MNYVTRDLVYYLIAQLPTIGEVNQDIFFDYTPKSPDNIITFNEYTGSGVAMFTNTSVRSVQCLVRNQKNTTAQEIAWEVFNIFKPGSPILDLGNVKALMNMRDTPFRRETDKVGRSIWVFNMGITYNYKSWNPLEFE